MSDKDSVTPRVFLARHGETTWAKSGRYTGTTDVDLTPAGVAQVSSTAAALVGAGKLIDPSCLAEVIVSPRKRAKNTCKLLLSSSQPPPPNEQTWNVTCTEDVAEWDYGDYEGLMVGEIRELRKKRGLESTGWSIWRDGCEGGESKDQVTERLDRVIQRIRDVQNPYMNGEKPVDVLLVAHGLILRCFVKRWLGFAVDFPLEMILAPGAVAVLSYKENNADKPALLAGIALPSTPTQI